MLILLEKSEALILEDEADHIDRHDQPEFLAIVDYLSNFVLTTLIPHIQAVATEFLTGKRLRDPFNSTTLEICKLDQLMVEAWEVFSSTDFMILMEVSLRSVVDALGHGVAVHRTRNTTSKALAPT
ncbi:hypothetical protein GIB67_043270 [Kingdonia uniflora]|uniref:Uncharacterized protein n=1 Tax=Kingdonia uniflora TaxID=39325 RepID=A0A7J7L0K2_9MAGN|nr:hypothetical protein GIB67_043270 [Kingdonia uniflora]